jgi:hypothetical protein
MTQHEVPHFFMLRIEFFYCYAECYISYRYSECSYAECYDFCHFSILFMDEIMLSVIMLSVIMLSVIMLRVIILSVIMLSVIMLSVIMLSVIMLSVIMLNVIMLSVNILSVVAPFGNGTIYWNTQHQHYIGFLDCDDMPLNAYSILYNFVQLIAFYNFLGTLCYFMLNFKHFL